MLKSTHIPSSQANAVAPLPAGWTEHKAPTGHTYYYNAATKQSTYSRPSEPNPALPPSQGSNVSPRPAMSASQSYLQYKAVSNLDSRTAPVYDTLQPQGHFNGGGAGHNNQRSGKGAYEQHRDRRPQPVDKPKSKHSIPGCEPWLLVHTKLGRRFVYHPDKNQSYWRIPEKLKDGILALDQQRIKEKAAALVEGEQNDEVDKAPGASQMPSLPLPLQEQTPHEPRSGDDSSEYEEVEVTDDEEEANAPKRHRTEEHLPEEPVEFNEDDIAFQLAAMGQEYGLAPGEYDDGHMEEWEDGDVGLEISAEDSSALFKDLLNDSGVSPYSPWSKIVEDGKLVDDTRYTALTNMKARKLAWEEWSRDKIKQLREQKLSEEKKDPRIPFMAFLQTHATPKLYWPEFKRKYKKEPEMREASISDKDREKWYREHINRLKLPHSTLKSDLIALLKSQPLSALNNNTLPSHLPPAVLADIRYISIDPEIRDPLIEAFISTLASQPTAPQDDESEESIKKRQDRERRNKALEERERQVAEEKLRQRRNLEVGKARLREEEADIARAMTITKKGLMDHIMAGEQDATSKSPSSSQRH